MNQEETNNDAALAETLAPVAEEAPVEQPATETQEPPAQQPDQQALRFKTIRQERERAERERDQIKAELDRLRNAQVHNTAPVAQEDYFVAPDDLVEGKHLNSEIKKIREELKAYKKHATAMTVDARIKSKYVDFDSVVTKENIAMLRTAHPELAATINSSPDLYNQAVSAYTLIKQFGLSENPVHARQQARVQANVSKPLPAAAISPQASNSPLSHANEFAGGLTPELKKQLMLEMIAARKNR
jgi:hypothetical protein